MGLIETASSKSVWKGLDYYENGKVITWEKSGDSSYDGTVRGSEDTYTVHVDTAHPKRSVCNCAFANGRRVICKHMVALYFTAEPKAAEEFLEQVRAWDQEEEERENEHYEELYEYVMNLTKQQLQMELLDALLELEERKGGYW